MPRVLLRRCLRLVLPLPLAAVLATLAVGCADTQTNTNPVASNAGGAEVIADPVRSLERVTSDASGFDTHSYWLDTGREVVVFDAQFTETHARRVIAEIQAKTANPIRWLVVTHPNPDKFNGAPAFQALGAKVVASETTARAIPGVHAYKKHYFVEVAKMFTEATYPKEATVDVTFRGDYDLPLQGAFRVRLHELAHAGVSSTQTVAIVPQRDAVIVGDLVHHRAHAWLEGGIVDGKPAPDLASWRLALGELRALAPDAILHGGRGEPAPTGVAVTSQIAYLDRLHEIVASYVGSLGPAAKEELSGPNAAVHHKKLAALAAQAFPDHTLPYLVEFGVYGLAGAIARR